LTLVFLYLYLCSANKNDLFFSKQNMKKKNLLILLTYLSIAWVAFVNVVNAKSDYIYEKEVDGVNTITICDSADSSACITMMDRNLWATTNDITSDKSYWYHFQWWNNHGFKPWKVNTQNHVVFPNWETMWISQIDCSSYGPWNPLDSDVFIKWEEDYFNSEFDYCEEHNYNLWWWSGDYYETNRWYDTETYLVDNVIERQWPCPEWYHIPSNWEWHALLDFWTKNYWHWLSLHDSQLLKQINPYYVGSWEAAAAVLQFREDFKIPLAGYRDWYKWYVGWMWHDADFWSSSPYIYYDHVHSFHIGPNSIAAGSTAPYANAYSIRCFKNTPITSKSKEPTWNSTMKDDDHFTSNANVVNNNPTKTTSHSQYSECNFDTERIFDWIVINKNRLINVLKCVYLKTRN